MCTPSHYDSEPKGNTIVSIPYNWYSYGPFTENGQSDDAMTGLNSEDNQQTSQQESTTELATVVPI